MRNPTDKELLLTVELHTLAAAVCVKSARVSGQFSRQEGDEMLALLQNATAAMMELHCLLRGVPPPIIGH